MAKPKKSASIRDESVNEKPRFVRKPYLTQRPLKNDPALLALKKGLSK